MNEPLKTKAGSKVVFSLPTASFQLPEASDPLQHHRYLPYELSSPDPAQFAIPLVDVLRILFHRLALEITKCLNAPSV